MTKQRDSSQKQFLWWSRVISFPSDVEIELSKNVLPARGVVLPAPFYSVTHMRIVTSSRIGEKLENFIFVIFEV